MRVARSILMIIPECSAESKGTENDCDRKFGKRRIALKLTSIEIKNFRGIKHASVFFPLDSRIICLIGAGDSGKSTLLTAIEWTLWPSWSLIATDTDFYDCDTSSPIEITVSIMEIPQALMKEDKFGLYLRDYDKARSVGDDEPTDTGTTILTIQLTIDDTLEPKWSVITNRTDPRPISQKDRRLLSFGVVGFDHEKDFQWGRGSILQKYTDSREALHTAFTQAMRAAVENTSLEALDQMAPALKEVGKQYGVDFNGEIHNRLLMQNGSYSTTVGVFDDKVPFAQRGLGSKRLVSIGMNVNAYENGTVVLVDEVETGLEPYRISALINQFRYQFKEHGQLVMTTHSMSAVCECTVNEVCVCYNNDGELKLHRLNEKDAIKADVQALLRTNPDAFLCKRVIVCEGKTEVGLLRAFDSYLVDKGIGRFAHFGVTAIPGGGGDNFFQLALLLHECGYDVSILMDSDIPEEETKKQQMREKHIPVFDWESGYAIEEQIFHDVSLGCIDDLLAIAIEEHSFDKVMANFNRFFQPDELPCCVENEEISVYEDISTEERVKIGTVAKHRKSEWYKNTSKGEMIGNRIFQEFDDMAECRFKTQIIALQNWVTGHES